LSHFCLCSAISCQRGFHQDWKKLYQHPLLDKAKKKAEEIISAYGPSDNFQIFSHEMRGSQQRWLSQENTVAAIEEINVSPEVTRLSQVNFKLMQSAPDDGNHIIYYLSDFQKSITDFEFQSDTTTEVNLIPFQAIKENNISIDSAWFEAVVPSVNQNNKLYVRIKNYSNERKDDVRLSIVHNGQTRPEGTVNIPANSSITDTINILVTEAGWQDMTVKIDDYPIQFDDQYYISFDVKSKVNTLSINEGSSNRYLTALFKGMSQFDLMDMTTANIQYDRFKEKDLVILDDLNSISSGLAAALQSYVSNGGNLLIFPSSSADIKSYNDLYARLGTNTMQQWNKEDQNVHKINTTEFVFNNVYESTGRNLKLPTTKGHFTFSNYSTRGGESLLEYRNGQDFVTKYTLEKGNIYLCAAPLNKDYNDLAINAEIFVPLLYKVSYSNSQSEKITYTIGVDNLTEVNSVTDGSEIIYKITGEEEFIPGQTNQGSSTVITFNDMVKKAGFYKVRLQDQIVKGLGFNFDRVESALEQFSAKELNSQYGEKVNILDNILNADLATIIKEKDQGVTLWRWFLILALVFLAIETLLLRFWKL